MSFPTDWRAEVARTLPVMGHRNWIVVVDSAYPEQSNPGITTIETGAGQLEVVKGVLSALAHSKHVRPITYLDAELKYVPEDRAPGVGAYRDSLSHVLAGREIIRKPHEDIIHLLDESAKTFTILVLKTNETIPYTSVFFNLNCAYWSDAAEAELRAKMKSLGGN